MALLAMGMFRPRLRSQHGCIFLKLLGRQQTAHFDLKPDWSNGDYWLFGTKEQILMTFINNPHCRLVEKFHC